MGCARDSKDSHTAVALSLAPGLDPGPSIRPGGAGPARRRTTAASPTATIRAPPARRAAIAGRRCPWYHPGGWRCSGRRWRVQFGGFMYFQNRGLDTTRVYDEHLAEIELMEDLGFDEVCLAEHHFTHYGMLPSPNLVLATLAARTRRVRLGNMISVLPFYDPLRLAEEITMLDHLTHGRLNVGIGSGVQREYARRGLRIEDAKPRFYEAADVLLKALTQERFDHDGQFWHYEDA